MMTASSDHLCDRCGAAEATTGLSDEVSDPPRYLQLCERCLTAEKGVFFLNALRELGESLPAELEAADEATAIALGQWWDHAFLDSMDAKALTAAEAEDDEATLRGIAETLEAHAARFDRRLTRAQRAFVRRHREQAI